MRSHIILRLELPLMAFGATMIDATGPTEDFPYVSLITGLLANALGKSRGERERHQRLQDRLVIGVRLDRPGRELRDFQTAKLAKNDKGWTTRGLPEGRGGGNDTYKSPHIRERFYVADAVVTVALRLQDPDERPTLSQIADALRHPARPLFIGRKPCLPSVPLLAGTDIDAFTVLDALRQWPLDYENLSEPIRLVIPSTEAPLSGQKDRAIHRTDERNWISGVHAGESVLHLIDLPRAAFPVRTEAAA